MRLMLTFTIPVAKGNAAAADGSLGRAIEKLIGQLKPEATYFTLADGKRAGMLFFEADDSALMPAVVEPFCAAVEAAIEVVPVLNADELKRGLAAVKL